MCEFAGEFSTTYLMHLWVWHWFHSRPFRDMHQEVEMVRKVLRVGGVATLLAGVALLATPSSAMAAGSCSTYLTDAGHTAVGKCSGYLNTGTFRVVATSCYSTS